MESQPRILIVGPDEVLRALLITMLEYQSECALVVPRPPDPLDCPPPEIEVAISSAFTQ